MNFFEHQKQAKRKSILLIFLYVLAILSTITIAYIGFYFFIFLHQQEANRLVINWHPMLFTNVSIGTLLIILVGSLYKTIQLGGAGSKVAELLGGRLISPGTRELSEQKLVNVVEEIAIASGIPIPKIYVLDQESAINAFAAGTTIKNAVIAVSRGALEELNRDELQGVIAHEYSHILNGDMALNIRLIGIVHGLLIITLSGRALLNVSMNSSSRKRPPLGLIGLILLLAGALGYVFGNLLKLAVSRQREFLADASAVQFTRQTQGIASALKKIGLSSGILTNRHASEVSHMFFADGVKHFFFTILSTHPPLKERIKRIDASINMNLAEKTSHVNSFGSNNKEDLMNFIGNTTAEAIANTQQQLAELPTKLVHQSRTPEAAARLIIAIMIRSQNSDLRFKLLNELQIDSNTIASLIPELETFDTRKIHNLIDLSLQSVKQLSELDIKNLYLVLNKIVVSDGEIDLFEFMLHRGMLHYLFPSNRKNKLQLNDAIPIFVSFLIKNSMDQEDLITSALVRVSRIYNNKYNFQYNPSLELKNLDQALDSLDAMDLAEKETLLEATISIICLDNQITGRELEMLRSLCYAISVPMPNI